MQFKLPLFPAEATLDSSCLGVYERDGMVQYIVNGLPVYTHGKEEFQEFRYITSNFIDQKLCRKVDVQRCFNVSEDSISRAFKKIKEKGSKGFFDRSARKRSAHKIVGKKRKRIQSKLDTGQSVNSIRQPSFS